MFKKGSREQREPEKQKQKLAVGAEQGGHPAWPLSGQFPDRLCGGGRHTGFPGPDAVTFESGRAHGHLFPCSPTWRLVSWVLESLPLSGECDSPSDVLL